MPSNETKAVALSLAGVTRNAVIYRECRLNVYGPWRYRGSIFVTFPTGKKVHRVANPLVADYGGAGWIFTTQIIGKSRCQPVAWDSPAPAASAQAEGLAK